jgi:hypothetical protein
MSVIVDGDWTYPGDGECDLCEKETSHTFCPKCKLESCKLCGSKHKDCDKSIK